MITSIWENDFYNTPPQPLYAFEVVFDQFADIAELDGKLLAKAVKTITMAERKTNPVPIYYGGMEFRHQGRVENAGEVTITFNEDQNLSVTNILTKLFNKISWNQNWPKSTGSQAYVNKAGNNKIILKILKPDSLMYGTDGGTYSKQITYNNCILMNIGEVEFSYDSEEVMEIQASFSYNYMETTVGETAYTQGSTDYIAEKVNEDTNGQIPLQGITV